MAALRLSSLALLLFLTCSFVAVAQPTITKYTTSDFSRTCTFTVGKSTKPCPMGPGTKLIIEGSGFWTGSIGVVTTCDCPILIASARDFTNTKITGYVNSVGIQPTNSMGITVETSVGEWSNAVPYTPLAAQITKLVVGDCTYIPNQSPQQCFIAPGMQFTVYGNYFGGGGETPELAMCDCIQPSVIGMTPDWYGKPSANNNSITATANDVVCGSTIIWFAEGVNSGLPSNAVAYACQ